MQIIPGSIYALQMILRASKRGVIRAGSVVMHGILQLVFDGCTGYLLYAAAKWGTAKKSSIAGTIFILCIDTFILIKPR